MSIMAYEDEERYLRRGAKRRDRVHLAKVMVALPSLGERT